MSAFNHDYTVNAALVAFGTPRYWVMKNPDTGDVKRIRRCSENRILVYFARADGYVETTENEFDKQDTEKGGGE